MNCATASPSSRACGIPAAADPAAARADLDAAVAAHKQAIADCETHRKVAEAAAKRLGERTTRANVAREKLSAAQTELTAARERLTLQRATATDDELAVKAEADGEEARRATGLVAELGAELARSAPDTVTAALNDAVRRADSLGSRHDEACRGAARGDRAAQGVRHRGP